MANIEISCLSSPKLMDRDCIYLCISVYLQIQVQLLSWRNIEIHFVFQPHY